MLKLTILPKTSPSAAAGAVTGNTESDNHNSISNKVVQDILLMESHKCRGLKHLVLACPIDKFFDVLAVAFTITNTLSLSGVQRMDLQALVDNNTTTTNNNNTTVLATSGSAPSPVVLILTTLEEEARTITVHLETMSDQILLDAV